VVGGGIDGAAAAQEYAVRTMDAADRRIRTARRAAVLEAG
jgi:hypothetical protein